MSAENATQNDESISGALSEVLEAEGELVESDDATLVEDVEEASDGDAEITTEEDWVGKWNDTHDKNVLPDQMRKVYDDLVAGAQRVMSKADLAQKQAEARVAELEANAVTPEGVPSPELDYSSEERLAETTGAMVDHRAQKIADERLSPIEKQQQQLIAQFQQLEGQRRYDALTKREGYTQDVGTYMDSMAQKPAWQAALQADPDGALDEMFSHAQLNVNNAQSKAESNKTAKAKAAASKRPSTGSKSADGKTIAGDTIGEVIANALAESS